MVLCCLPVGAHGAHPPAAVYGLVAGGGEDQELVPLVGEEAGVDVDGDILVEGQAPRPLHQLHHDVVSDPAEAVRQLSVAVVQQVVHVLNRFYCLNASL